MPTPADQRLLDLLSKWLTSLELHARYATLDDAAYARAQEWPEHERPTRWVIEVARQKTLELRKLLDERIAAGDERFADALELTIFLANLVGSQHIERFIPLAEPPQPAAPDEPAAPVAAPAPDAVGSATREMPRPDFEPVAADPPAAAGAAARERTGTTSITREMPRFPSPPRPPLEPAGTVARVERKAVAAGRTRADTPLPAGVREQVIADAVRLLQWGRKWHELAELVARIADRPPLADVRRILKENKPQIERQAKQP